MTRRSLLPVCLAAGVLGCATLPQQIAKADGRVLVQGSKSSFRRVLIRTVDGGGLLWVGGYQLGNEAWLSPGPHKIETMCEFLYSWGTKILPGNTVGIDVEQGGTYSLDGAMSGDGKQCEGRLREPA